MEKDLDKGKKEMDKCEARAKRRTWMSWDDKAELSAPRNPRFLRPELFPRFKGIGRETHSGECAQADSK